jgi:hypothetical protein
VPNDHAVRTLQRLHETVDVQNDDLLASLRELIARNSWMNPGSDRMVEDAPDAPDRVDEFLRRTALLRRIDRALAQSNGRFAADRQLWTTSATIARADPPPAPRADSVEPVRQGPIRPSGGLWTSTALTGAVSPWSLWREVGSESSSFVGAATSWRLTADPDVAVCEIAGAVDWVALVSRARTTTLAGVAPDWAAVATEYDAVHFTMTAAVALQGTSYRLADGSRTVPMYVDVESTFWLRWAFTTVVPLPDMSAA